MSSDFYDTLTEQGTELKKKGRCGGHGGHREAGDGGRRVGAAHGRAGQRRGKQEDRKLGGRGRGRADRRRADRHAARGAPRRAGRIPAQDAAGKRGRATAPRPRRGAHGRAGQAATQFTKLNHAITATKTAYYHSKSWKFPAVLQPPREKFTFPNSHFRIHISESSLTN